MTAKTPWPGSQPVTARDIQAANRRLIAAMRRHKVAKVGPFDAAAWFESRRPALKLFDVLRVEIEALCVNDSQPGGRFP